MNRLESALDDCLERLAGGDATLEDCLSDHPEFAKDLLPLLKTASRVTRGTDVEPLPEFRQRARAGLMEHMRAHPRGSTTARTRGFLPVYRLAVGLTVLALAVFITGTALAQSALPGSPLYGWKLASESTWRVISPDPVGTDLALAERRAQELLAVSGSEREVALQGYQEVLGRLKTQANNANQERIIPVLIDQRENLAQAGISVPELDEYLSPQPGRTPSPLPLIPTPALPGLISTPVMPFDVPTSEVPPVLEIHIP